jgi:hypothetical protein
MKKVVGDIPSEGLIGYDPGSTFRPTGDILNISATPGSGATTAEEWKHQTDLAAQQQKALEFEWQQRMQADESARAAAALAIQQAEEGRNAALGASKQEAARLANLATAQQTGIAGTAEQRAAAQSALEMKYAGTGEARTAAEAVQKAQMNTQTMALQRAEEQRKAVEEQRKATDYKLAHWGLPPDQAGDVYRNLALRNMGTGDALIGSTADKMYTATFGGRVPTLTQGGRLAYEAPGGTIYQTPSIQTPSSLNTSYYTSGYPTPAGHAPYQTIYPGQAARSEAYYQPAGGGMAVYLGNPNTLQGQSAVKSSLAGGNLANPGYKGW